MIEATASRRFEQVLKRQELDDVSVLLQPGFFDEIPLYSRYRQVEWLGRFGDLDRLLLGLGINYLNRIVTRATLQSQFFAGVTVLDEGGDVPIVPSIYVCVGWVDRRMGGKLLLSEPRAASTKRIANLVQSHDLASDFWVLEDRRSIPGEVKAFVGHRHRLFPSHRTIEDFLDKGA